MLKNNLFKKIVSKVKSKLFNDYSNKSYSQEGEDMVLRRIFDNKKNGFYIDIGAHHPFRFSNTCFFYKKGWHGINVDAMPGSMCLFEKYRPRDINIESAISTESKEMTYHIFNDPALNGFDKKLSTERDSAKSKYKIIKTVEIKTMTLCSILNQHLADNQKIDFLSVDVEGLDLDVLKSNDWNKYRPEVVLVEILGSSLSELEKSDVYKYLNEHGYIIYAKAVNTVIFKRSLQ